MKSKYDDFFLNSMLAAVNSGMGMKGFKKEFPMKDAIYAAAYAWNTLDKETLAQRVAYDYVQCSKKLLCQKPLLFDKDKTCYVSP
ncbi:hypothetical protein scyTo_0006964 [Scyliorhinus torazame]|uniref:Uncharacterized protein n=1 Tax=Scyliorhinus torazame TaxID=75743 RepID=A0A401NJB1_SCYTO|nr:hypothetical protein [Scyliorhinus torazame]